MRDNRDARFQDIPQYSLVEVANAIKRKLISPVEIVQSLLARIESTDERLNAYITVLSKQALYTAKQAERDISLGRAKGLLHGVPVGLKDIIMTQGIRTTMGSACFKDHVPEYSASVVEKLERAGAIVLGKLNTHEFAYGPTGDRSYFGPVKNPWDPKKISGGSSGGAGAAVASGLCYAALGTDTGGSVRIPAAFCGIVGMKPTYGRVSSYGVFPLSWTLDSVGPMTRTVEDNAVVLSVISGFDDRDLYSVRRPTEDFTSGIGQDLRNATIGVLRSFYFDQLENEVGVAIANAIETLEDAGAKIRSVEIPKVEEMLQAYRTVLATEAYAVHKERLNRTPEHYDEEVRTRLLKGNVHKAHEYASALQLQHAAFREFDRVFEEVDILVTPTVSILPTDLGQ